ncbi:MAG TPA: hypothetical protein VI756_01030 [Blastocatellia bacterium]
MERAGTRTHLRVFCLLACGLLWPPSIAGATTPESNRDLEGTVCSSLDVSAWGSHRQEDGKFDSFLQQVRRRVLDFKSQLPDFLVHQHVTRYAGWHGSWIQQDTLDTEETYEAGKGQRSRLLKHNGRASDEEYAKLRGALSFGVFSTALATLFQSNNKIEFDKGTPKQFRRRAVLVYAFSVPLGASQLTLGVNGTGSEVHVAYSGLIWVDQETHQVLKLEQSTPKADPVPVGLEKMVIEYDWVNIEDHRLVLPIKAEIVLRQAGHEMTYSRSVIKFTGYQRFSGEIKMEPVPPTPKSGSQQLRSAPEP